MKIVVIGPGFDSIDRKRATCATCNSKGKTLIIELYDLFYCDYFHSEKFSKPDIVFDYETRVCNSIIWMDSLLMLHRICCPVIFAVSDKVYLNKCSVILNGCFEISSQWEDNPFASLQPKRASLLKTVHYDNKYVLMCNELNFRIHKSIPFTLGLPEQVENEVQLFYYEGFKLRNITLREEISILKKVIEKSSYINKNIENMQRQYSRIARAELRIMEKLMKVIIIIIIIIIINNIYNYYK